MTPRQIELIQNSFAQIQPFSRVIAGLFYGRLFKNNPELRPMFKGDLHIQGEKLMTTLQVVVAGLTNLERIVPAVQHLGRSHARYGVKDEHYGAVATALIWALKQALGPDFTREVEAAWVTAYTLLADTMQAAAAEALETEPMAA